MMKLFGAILAIFLLWALVDGLAALLAPTMFLLLFIPRGGRWGRK